MRSRFVVQEINRLLQGCQDLKDGDITANELFGWKEKHEVSNPLANKNEPVLKNQKGEVITGTDEVPSVKPTDGKLM